MCNGHGWNYSPEVFNLKDLYSAMRRLSLPVQLEIFADVFGG